MSFKDHVHRCMQCGENYYHVNGVVKTVKKLSNDMLDADYEKRVYLFGNIQEVLEGVKVEDEEDGDL